MVEVVYKKLVRKDEDAPKLTADQEKELVQTVRAEAAKGQVSWQKMAEHFDFVLAPFELEVVYKRLVRKKDYRLVLNTEQEANLFVFAQHQVEQGDPRIDWSKHALMTGLGSGYDMNICYEGMCTRPPYRLELSEEGESRLLELVPQQKQQGGMQWSKFAAEFGAKTGTQLRVYHELLTGGRWRDRHPEEKQLQTVLGGIAMIDREATGDHWPAYLASEKQILRLQFRFQKCIGGGVVKRVVVLEGAANVYLQRHRIWFETFLMRMQYSAAEASGKLGEAEQCGHFDTDREVLQLFREAGQSQLPQSCVFERQLTKIVTELLRRDELHHTVFLLWDLARPTTGCEFCMDLLAEGKGNSWIFFSSAQEQVRPFLVRQALRNDAILTSLMDELRQEAQFPIPLTVAAFHGIHSSGRYMHPGTVICNDDRTTGRVLHPSGMTRRLKTATDLADNVQSLTTDGLLCAGHHSACSDCESGSDCES